MSRAVIITGMHRSGTSLVSSLMQGAGVHVGDNLLAANSANPRGYFEDVDFYEFHEGLLHQRGKTYLHVDDSFTFEPTDSEIAAATKLIGERSHHSVWGWKDPRTSLFLNFWDRLLPDGRFLFVFRHPIEVLLSLLRRGEFDSHPTLLAGLNAWYVYNRNIEIFFDAHPARCVLAHIDGIAQQSDRFAELLRHKLRPDVGLNSEVLGQKFHANELQKIPFSPELTAALTKIHPPLVELYQRLIQKADLCTAEGDPQSAAPPDLCHVKAFCDTLPEPITGSVKQGLTQLLLSSLAPEAMEKMLASFNRSTKETQQKIDYLWMEVQRFQRLEVSQNQELESLRSLVDQQQSELVGSKQAEISQRHAVEKLQRLTDVQNQSLDNLQWLNLEQIKELNRQAIRLELLLGELSSIHGTRIWKAIESCRTLKERWKNSA